MKIKKYQQLLAIFVGIVALSVIIMEPLQKNFNIIGEYDVGGYTNDFFVVGDYAYVAAGNSGLEIIDISDPTIPTKVGQYENNGSVRSVYVLEPYAYVTVSDGWDGLRIIDISDPTAPTQVGQFEDNGESVAVYVSGSYAYVADIWDGLVIIDVADPTTPIEVGRFSDGGHNYDVFIVGGYAYVAAGDDGLRIFDVSIPTAPSEVGQFNDGGSANAVFVNGGYAYVADGGDGLEIINISKPYHPVEVGQFYDGESIRDIYVSGLDAYVVTYSGVKIIDVSDPTAPTKVIQFNEIRSANSVYVSGSYAYVVSYYGGLEIIDPWSPKELLSNVILGSLLGLLTLLALVDIRYLLMEIKPLWTETLQKWREVRDPYKAGEKNKGSDTLMGFLFSIGLMILFTPILYFGLLVMHFFDIWSLVVVFMAYIGLLIGLVISFFKKNRRFVAIGMMVPVSLLIMGFMLWFLFAADWPF